MDSVNLSQSLKDTLEKLKITQEEVQQDLLSVEMRLDKYLFESDSVSELLKTKKNSG